MTPLPPVPFNGVPHPDVARLAEQFEAAGVPTYDKVGVIRARAILENVTRNQGPAKQVARVDDLLVPGAEGLLPVRVYRPSAEAGGALVVYLHGGGWALGGIRVADRPCRALAARSGATIASVEYRRAPETKFPGPLQDSVCAIRWLAEHADDLGADERAVVVMGDSAGGNLAAAAALVLRDEGGPPLAAQILLYPCLSPARSSPYASMREFADGPLMTRRELEWFWDMYLRSEADAADPRAAPLVAIDLQGLPPATVIVPELDPLRDEALAYVDRMRQAGVDARAIVYPGAAHGFWWLDAELRQAAELTDELAGVLRAIP